MLQQAVIKNGAMIEIDKAAFLKLKNECIIYFSTEVN